MIIIAILLLIVALVLAVFIGWANMMSDNPEAKTSQRWPIVLVLLAIALLAIRYAQAAPPENADPALAPWFEGLRQPGTGISCCSIADCRPVDAKTGPIGWMAFIENEWRDVPNDKIVRGKDNPVGRAVVCWTPARGVMCFVEPAGV